MKQTILTMVIFVSSSFNAEAENCVNCHKTVTPNIVSDWQISKHSQNDVGC